MWDSASTTAVLTTSFASIGVAIALTVTAVLAAWAGLVGLGFGKKKATKYVTGKKF